MAFAFGIYVVIRAFNIPITVDECSTAVTHVPRTLSDLLFLKTDANPNNHILNTILIKLFTGIFGWHPFVVRLPALLGAFAYAVSGWLLCRRIFINSWIGVFAYAMFLGQPYMLEFFSLARGYSLGLGCMVTAIWFAARFFEKNSRIDLLWSAVFTGLAVYASFTETLFAVPFAFITLLLGWQRRNSVASFWHQAGPALSVYGIWGILLIVPLLRFSNHSEVKIWVRIDSLFQSTMRTMDAAIHRNPLMGRDAAEIFTWMALSFTWVVGITALYKWRRSNWKIPDFKTFLVLLLLAVLIFNIIQVKVTGVTYLQPRLALFYWPLFALSLGAGTTWLYESVDKWTWALVIPTAVLTFTNVGTSVNLREASEWWHDRDTYTVLNYIGDAYKKEARTEPFTMDMYNLLQNSFIFHLDRDPREFRKWVKTMGWHPGPPEKEGFDFFYTLSEDALRYLDKYDVVLRLPASDRVLLRKKTNPSQ